jgi:hypothetical protein
MTRVWCRGRGDWRHGLMQGPGLRGARARARRCVGGWRARAHLPARARVHACHCLANAAALAAGAKNECPPRQETKVDNAAAVAKTRARVWRTYACMSPPLCTRARVDSQDVCDAPTQPCRHAYIVTTHTYSLSRAHTHTYTNICLGRGGRRKRAVHTWSCVDARAAWPTKKHKGGSCVATEGR